MCPLTPGISGTVQSGGDMSKEQPPPPLTSEKQTALVENDTENVLYFLKCNFFHLLRTNQH